MNHTNHSSRSLLVVSMLLFILACTLPTSQPVAPVQVVTVVVSATSEQSFITPSPFSTFPPPTLPIGLSTFTPTYPPTFTPTFIPTFTFTPTFTPTSTITSTSTNTPLPPLPEFDEVLSFGFGGGGGVCPGPNQEPNTILVDQGGRFVGVCFWLKGFDGNQPFQMVLFQPDRPGSVHLTTPNLVFEASRGKLKWAGYVGYFFSDCGERKGITHCYDLLMLSPVRLSVGKWRISIVQKKSNFGVYSQDFSVEREVDRPYLSVLSSRPKTEINPMRDYYSHLVIPKDNGKVDVIGENFPSNKPIYILLYRQTSDNYGQDMRLINKQAVRSDFNGDIFAELPGPFDSGFHYIVIGVSNPKISLTNEFNWFDFNAAPIDSFIATNSVSSISCPGAPPQRMAVNQRGYVCTQSDRVRLRNAPAKSASTIVYVNTGTQFTVIGGPSCSDNWSWWNVRLNDGTIGWLAEGGDAVDSYFVCPLP